MHVYWGRQDTRDGVGLDTGLPIVKCVRLIVRSGSLVPRPRFPTAAGGGHFNVAVM